jgi:hypothetical protein
MPEEPIGLKSMIISKCKKNLNDMMEDKTITEIGPDGKITKKTEPMLPTKDLAKKKIPTRDLVIEAIATAVEDALKEVKIDVLVPQAGVGGAIPGPVTIPVISGIGKITGLKNS